MLSVNVAKGSDVQIIFKSEYLSACFFVYPNPNKLCYRDAFRYVITVGEK